MTSKLSHATVRPAARARSLGATAALVVLLTLIIASCGSDEPASQDPAKPTAAFAWPTGPHPRAVFHVRDYGTLLLELYPELAPLTVASFIELARTGFFDGTTFHRVVPGVGVAALDHETGHDEPSAAPHTRGTVAMANTGRPNSGGSQFFIVQGDAQHLDGRHTVFARVAAGIEVADAIANVKTDLHGRWGKPNRPLEDVVIDRIEILEPPAPRAPAARPGPTLPSPESKLGPERPRLFPALAQR